MERASNIKSNAALLRFIAKTDAATQTRVLKLADKKLISALCEICHNTLHGIVTLRKKEKKILEKHKDHLRKVAKKGENWKKKKKRLLLAGKGFLAAIINPLLSVLLGFLAKKL